MASFFPPSFALADSYKAGHFQQYPDALAMSAYGEFRSPFDKDPEDHRMVFYGMRYIIETHLLRRWTEDDLTRAKAFFGTHGVNPLGQSIAFPFPLELMEKIVREHDGYFPVTIQALPEGTPCHVRLPVYQITATGEFAKLVTYLETILTHVWYPTAVATKSRRVRDTIQAAFDKSVDLPLHVLVPSRLHDFGFRGCTCVEQSILGGTAHLLSFTGSDTMSAAYYAQFNLNGGRSVASSIPATEHSVMTSWPTELAAMRNLVSHNKGAMFACVMDSYDYDHALNQLLPEVAGTVKASNGFMVLRPDSGDPVEAVLAALVAGEKAFGATLNEKGFKQLHNAAVIQGDGIDPEVVKQILDRALAEGYAACNIAFGMGGGLLQKVNRDTLSFATKLNHIQYADGTRRATMKDPKTDPSKCSIPGRVAVRLIDGIPTAVPEADGDLDAEWNMLRVVYRNGPVANAFPDDFDTMRARVVDTWPTLPKKHRPWAPEIFTIIEQWRANRISSGSV